MKNVHIIKSVVEGKEWTDTLDAAFNKKKKDIKMDGFRQGAVPKDVFIKKVGIESLYMDAVDIAVSAAYNKAIRDNKLIPVVEPAMDIKEIDETHVEFEFTIITKPEIKLGAYTKLGVKADEVKVTKKEIEAEIAKLASQFAEIVVKEKGKVETGNTAVIDFEGKVDGEILEGGTGANYPLEIGSHTFIPGFEEGVEGMKLGETKVLNLQFPDNYTEVLKGKDVEFTVTVNEIKERVIPELNKDFYADLGFDNVETKEEFEAEVEKTIISNKEITREDKYINDCLEKAADNMTVEINPEIISDEVHRMIHQFEEQLAGQGLNIEQYYQFAGMDHEKLHTQMEPEATKRVKFRFLLEEVANAEKIEISDKEVDEEAEKMATTYGMAKDEFLNAFGGNEIVKYDLRMRKAIETVKAN